MTPSVIMGCSWSVWANWRARVNRSTRSRRPSRCRSTTAGPPRNVFPATSRRLTGPCRGSEGFDENKISYRHISRGAWPVACRARAGAGSRASLQAGQRRNLRLRSRAQRSQQHDYTHERRRRPDRYRTEPERLPRRRRRGQEARLRSRALHHPYRASSGPCHGRFRVRAAADGATASMKQSESFSPARIERETAKSPEMRDAFKGFRLVPPNVEYRNRMTLNVGERTFELYYLKNVHSEADTAIWLPKERVLFTAASVGVKRFGNHRPLVSIPDTLDAIRMMKALKPEVVIPGHGVPGSAKILDDMENYYDALMKGVGAMVKQGKSLDEIKKELKIAGTEDWEGKDRFPNNIEAAYRAVKGN